MFVTPQDFIDLPYNLPKMTDADTQTALTNFINRNEAIELRKILGGDLYNALVTGFNALPASFSSAATYANGNTVLYGSDIYNSLIDNNKGNIPGTDNTKWAVQPSNRWAKLSYGEDYIGINGAMQNWVGFKEPIRAMIYALWLRDNIDTSVQLNGVVQASQENAVNVTSAIRFSDALSKYRLKIGRKTNCKGGTLLNYLYSKYTVFNDIGATILNVNGDFRNYLWHYFKTPGFVNEFDL